MVEGFPLIGAVENAVRVFPGDEAPRFEGLPCGGLGIAHEPWTSPVNNYAIRWASKRYGPMPGSYQGPYPSYEETQEILNASTVVVDVLEAEKGRVAFPDKTIELDPKEMDLPIGQVLFDIYPIPDVCLIRAALLKDRVLILHKTRYAALIDIQTSKMFALQTAYLSEIEDRKE